jgi:hypothetical protein
MLDHACSPDEFLSTAATGITTSVAPVSLLFGQTVAGWRVRGILACDPARVTYAVVHEVHERRAQVDVFHVPALPFGAYTDGIYRVATGAARLLCAGVLGDGRPFVVHEPYDGSAVELAIEAAIAAEARRAGFELPTWPASTLPERSVAELQPEPDLPEPPEIIYIWDEPEPDSELDFEWEGPTPVDPPAFPVVPAHTARRWRTAYAITP